MHDFVWPSSTYLVSLGRLMTWAAGDSRLILHACVGHFISQRNEQKGRLLARLHEFGPSSITTPIHMVNSRSWKLVLLRLSSLGLIEVLLSHDRAGFMVIVSIGETGSSLYLLSWYPEEELSLAFSLIDPSSSPLFFAHLFSEKPLFPQKSETVARLGESSSRRAKANETKASFSPD
ncbi:hypothetical protein VNO77_27060 [Canavalia gladiata]|uniref:Uncharacterized protein n=1 Tax=Canavalia gladiata TaxID=3824 RepID=A0AAN9QA64_CANGL